MSLAKDPKWASSSNVIFRASPSNKPTWAVICGEAMRIRLSLKQFDVGYTVTYILAGTDIELPFTDEIVLCRTREDCDKVLMEQNILKMLNE